MSYKAKDNEEVIGRQGDDRPSNVAMGGRWAGTDKQVIVHDYGEVQLKMYQDGRYTAVMLGEESPRYNELSAVFFWLIGKLADQMRMEPIVGGGVAAAFEKMKGDFYDTDE